MAGTDSYRAFGVIHDEKKLVAPQRGLTEQCPDLAEALRKGIIGNYAKFVTPFGEKPICYADWTASGRAVNQIEEYVRSSVLPFYGNTHTTTSVTGHQSTSFRHEARQIVAEAVNARISGRAAEDVVIFTGSGTTTAVNKLVLSLGLHVPLPRGCDESMRPIVFTSSYEHHSNLLPWRESAADVVAIRYCSENGVCLSHLVELLSEYKHRAMKIGAFSACSNVTGILTNVDALAALMHRAGGLAFFDYASAAPYVKMDMNPVVTGPDSPYVYKDAIFFSGHKFVGGPGAPGVLIAKKNILPPRDASPTLPGGGTVFYVTEDHQRYLSNREEREEGGTPDILADIRMGLTIHLKQSFDQHWIHDQEALYSGYAFARLSKDRRILVLGRPSLEFLRACDLPSSYFSDLTAATAIPDNFADVGRRHMPIFSFLIRYGKRLFHHNFVAALLNDLFGVQIRGGCSCAGPFAQLLLGLGKEANSAIETALLDKHEVFRPGFCRFSLPYWLTKQEVDYIVDSVLFVAENGWKFLPVYRYNHKTGEWAHSTRLTRFPERVWISSFSVLDHTPSSAVCNPPEALCLEVNLKAWAVSTLEELLRKTQAAAVDYLSSLTTKKAASGNSDFVDSALEGLDAIRWFVVESDLNSDSSYTDSDHLEGPIDPSRFQRFLDNQSRSVSGDSNKSSGDSIRYPATEYSVQRSSTLRARVGGENASLPRYIQLALAVQMTHDDPKEAVAEMKFLDATSAMKPALKLDPSTRELTPDSLSTSLIAPSDAVLSCPLPNQFRRPNDNNSKPISIEGVVVNSLGTYYPACPRDQVTGKAIVPDKRIMKTVGQAIMEWGMIEDGDRLLLGLSGGKDSLSLLHILLAIQKKAPVKFSIACATVDPQTSSFDPSPLIPYVQSLGVPYHFLSQPIVENAKLKLQGDSLCAFCSRFKRGFLYSCCREYKYNKLVLAQHLDDFAESFFMSALHNGQVRTMKANYKIEAGDVHVIRPLAYLREKVTRDFSRENSLPVINENCPACFEQPKERERVKKLLKQEESMVPALFSNLRKALIPLMHEETYAVMISVAERVARQGRNPRSRPPLPTPREKKRLASGGNTGSWQEGNGGATTESEGKQNVSNSDTGAEDDAVEGPFTKRVAIQSLEIREHDEENEHDDDASHGNRDSASAQDVCETGGYCAPCYELM